MTPFAEALRATFGDRVRLEEPLAPFTTFRLGGPAEMFVTLDGADELQRAATLAGGAAVPITIIGGGSNLLIADAGIRGLVIRVRGGVVRQIDRQSIRADAGVTINGLVRWTIAHGLASLEAWAGTPGTVGGAIYGNAHFQGRNISDIVERVRLIDRDGGVQDVSAADMEFAYDYSRLHRTAEIVVSADFRVRTGEPEHLRAVARGSLAYRKRTQPLAMASAGCIFQNPDPDRDRLPAGTPWSAGALVDLAGLKGAREGQARVSPIHGNFIVNEGAASAGEVRALIDRCKHQVYREYGVRLREEIVSLGFDHGATVPGQALTSDGTESRGPAHE
jgi:UDP-N-acetylmuramate dehydrogenase